MSWLRAQMREGRLRVEKRSHTTGCFVGLLLFFAFWALLKPPFQAPDEFAHLVKAYSVTASPWTARTRMTEVHERFKNPLVDDIKVNVVPFHPEQKFAVGELIALKAVPWPNVSGWKVVKQESTAFSYPNLYYYFAFAIGQGVTELASLSPYQSVYAYRFASVLLSALCWTLVWIVLRQIGEIRQFALPVFLLLVLNPMTGYISSSISPDAVFNPVAILAALYCYRFLRDGIDGGRAFVAAVAAAMIKPAGLVLFPALACTLIALKCLRVPLATAILRALIIPLGAWCVVYVGFYALSTPSIHGPPINETIDIYLSKLPVRLAGFFVGMVGTFGWLDYRLPLSYYAGYGALLAVNGIATLLYRLRTPRPENGFVLFAFLFSLLFVAGTIAGEFQIISIAGYVIQGRYLIPASIGLAMALAHPYMIVRNVPIMYLALLNVLLAIETVNRYYAGEWSRIHTALPL